MDIQKYIESGILESFVLGELSEQESNEVISIAEQYPEIKLELNQIEEALQAAAFSSSILPPAEVKKGFMNFIENENTSTKTENKVELKVDKTTNKNRINYGMAASIGLLALSVGANLWLFTQLSNEKEKVSKLYAEKQSFANNLKTQQAAFENLNTKFELSQQINIQKIGLAGTAKMPKANAEIYWNNKTGETHLELVNSEATASNKSFQLWVIVDGKPLDMGTFTSKDLGKVIKMKTLDSLNSKPQAFAVTVEKLGGSATPTLEAMILMGKVI